MTETLSPVLVDARAPEKGSPLLPGLLAWELLGAGASCETWLCWSTALWCPVAVKLPALAEVRDADVTADLRAEAVNHELVRHPGFQRLWSSDCVGPVPHLVLEYVEGPTAATLHDQGALTAADVVLLGLQLLSSLRHLHRLGLVHLDVKATNVVVREGRAVLLDLGLLTPAGRVFAGDEAPGTPGHVAPELVATGAVGCAADVYSLGVTLRGLLARLRVDAAVGSVVDRMTAADPAERPDADAALRALHAALPAGSPGLWPSWATAVLDG